MWNKFNGFQCNSFMPSFLSRMIFTNWHLSTFLFLFARGCYNFSLYFINIVASGGCVLACCWQSMRVYGECRGGAQRRSWCYLLSATGLLQLLLNYYSRQRGSKYVTHTVKELPWRGTRRRSTLTCLFHCSEKGKETVTHMSPRIFEKRSQYQSGKKPSLSALHFTARTVKIVFRIWAQQTISLGLTLGSLGLILRNRDGSDSDLPVALATIAQNWFL